MESPASSSPAPPVPPLGRAAGVAVRWNGAAALVTLVSQLAQIFVLARWLSPAEFGLAAAALAVSGFASGFTDLGMTHALVRHQGLRERAWASAWWLSLCAGAVVALILAAAAPGLERGLRLDGLASLLVAASVALPFFGTASIFQARLQRHLQFPRLALGEILSAAVSFAAVIACLFWRPGPMALVAGQMTLWVMRCALLGVLSDLRPVVRVRASDLRDLSSFGAFQMGERALNMAAGNLDRLLVAAFLGPAATGFYTMASQIALRPIALFGPFVARSLLPLLARLQGDVPRMGGAYVRALSLLGLVAAAVTAVLVGLADPLLRTALGPGWGPAVLPLRILAVLGFFLMVGNVLGNLTLTLGKAGLNFWVNFAVLIARVLAIVVGSRFGVTGVAFGMLTITLLTLPLDVYLPKRWLGLDGGDVLASMTWALLPAAVAAVGMGMTAAYLAVSAPPAWPSWSSASVQLAGGLVVGAALFLLTASTLFRKRFRDARRELRDTLR